MDQGLLNYIRESAKFGLPPADIRKTLIASGWNIADVETAMIEVFPASTAPVPTPAPVVQPIPIMTAAPATTPAPVLSTIATAPSLLPASPAPAMTDLSGWKAYYEFPSRKLGWFLLLLPYILIIGALVLYAVGSAMASSSLSLGTPQAQAATAPKDCGSDVKCMLAALDSCTPATATLKTKIVFGGKISLTGGPSTTYSIDETDNVSLGEQTKAGCWLHVTNQAMAYKFEGNAAEDQVIAAATQGYIADYQGFQADCAYGQDAVAKLARWSADGIIIFMAGFGSTGMMSDGGPGVSCSGDYFSRYAQSVANQKYFFTNRLDGAPAIVVTPKQAAPAKAAGGTVNFDTLNPEGRVTGGVYTAEPATNAREMLGLSASPAIGLGTRTTTETGLGILRAIAGLMGILGILTIFISFPIGAALLGRRRLKPGVVHDTRSGAGTASVIPPEIGGWSWAGAFLGLLWGMYHHVWITLVAFVPGVGVIWWIIMGIKGKEWAWRSMPWLSVEHFKYVQKKWDFWGKIMILFPLIMMVIGLALTFGVIGLNILKAK